MAALRYRVKDKGANRVIYVTDKGQEFHFKLVFAGGQKAGFYDPKEQKLDHMMFGTVMQETPVLDENGEQVIDPKTKKPKVKNEKMKSRSGDTVKLAELLDESKERAL